MRADILIVGQGLAGTLLAWEFERAGLSFAIADSGHATAATTAAAGIINPITGRRLVKSWRIDTLLPAARSAFRELETALGVTLWRDMRVRRFFADDRERSVFAAKEAQGELAPFVDQERADDSGFWIRGAARVDLPALIAAARARWIAAGKLRVENVQAAKEVGRHAWVIDCTGRSAAQVAAFNSIPWEFSKGEILELQVNGLAPDVVLNRRQWIVPIAEGAAWIGATHEPGIRDAEPSAAGRVRLEAAARELLSDRPFAVVGHRSGVRVTLLDKRPVAGVVPGVPRLGVSNGLGAKGALWAPLLAQNWVRHVVDGIPFDPEIDLNRFINRPALHSTR